MTFPDSACPLSPSWVQVEVLEPSSPTPVDCTGHCVGASRGSLEGGKVSGGGGWVAAWFPWASGGGPGAGFRTLGRVSTDNKAACPPSRGGAYFVKVKPFFPRLRETPGDNSASKHKPRAQPVPTQWPLRAGEEWLGDNSAVSHLGSGL